jgi:methylglutaconyl-CoA hydratase
VTRVRIAVGEGIGRMTLARPDKKNALDRQMVDEIVRGLETLAGEAATRVVVVDGEGEDFCAGADLEALESLLHGGHEAQLDDARALGRVFTTIRQAPIPVIAAVHGRAIAGGAGLATACDIVLAHPDASFSFPEVRIGFVPAMVMTILRRVTTERHALDLALTGRTVSATEALAMGLVTRVLSRDDFSSQVEDVCAMIAKSPPDAMRRTKALFYELDGLRFDDSIERGAQANADARATPEFRSGLRRFLDKRRRSR